MKNIRSYLLSLLRKFCSLNLQIPINFKKFLLIINLIYKQSKRYLIWLFLLIFILVITPPVFPQINLNAENLVEESKQYYQQNNYALAIEKLEQARDIFQQQGERENLAITYTNLSRLYLALSRFKPSEDSLIQVKEAKNNLEKATEIFRQQQNYSKLVKNLNTLANLQLSLGEANKALKYFQETTTIYQHLSNKVGLSNSFIYQAEAMTKLGLTSRACHTLIQAFNVNSNQNKINTILCNPNHNFTEEELQQEQNKLNETEGLSEINNSFKEKYIQDFVININRDWSREKSSKYLDGLRILGNVLTQIGNANEAEILLSKTLVIIETQLEQTDLNREDYNNLIDKKAATLLTLSNALKAEGILELEKDPQHKYDFYTYQPWACQKQIDLDTVTIFYDKALEKNKQALTLITSKSTKIKAQLNYLNLLILTNNVSEAKQLVKQINFTNLPLTQSLVFAQIQYAKINKDLACLPNSNFNKNLANKEIYKWLKEAVNNAENLENNSLRSYAYGNLGGFYEQQKKLIKASKLTEQALYLAQPSDSPFLAYQWQWQLARLLTIQKNKNQAISYYSQGLKTLNKIKKDLLNINSDAEFSLRQNIIPFYYQYLDLLLEKNGNDLQIKEAISVVQLLQKAEIENFLRCDLDELNLINIDQLEELPAAIIYPILLENRLEIIVKMPAQNSQIYRYSSLNSGDSHKYTEKLRKELFELKASLPNSESKTILEHSKQIYNLLLKPIENYLPKEGTLVFVLDSNSGLQNIPLAVLHDGNKYLIEKYSLAVSLTPQLPHAKPLKLQDGNVLLAGISQQAPSFSNSDLGRLDKVEEELKNISQIVSSRQLQNEEFTKNNLEKEVKVNDFSVIHLATHGKFHSNPQETVIYAWDKKINVNDLGSLLQQKAEISPSAVELLVLSACETATGDEKATLGIAGIALKAEASSTLASLWKVDDGKTADFMTGFYQELKQNQNKAEALRKVQLSFINDTDTKHPRDWSAFILVGNWL